jgi:hypothetical protein
MSTLAVHDFGYFKAINSIGRENRSYPYKATLGILLVGVIIK